jgi:two-component system chemotaxis sensor kinase CheA
VDQSLRDFISEAEDILDNLESSISLLMDLAPDDHRKPDLINAIFRSAHSLKGLSGMLNLDRISTLAHRMESLLDGMRLDKVSLTPDVVDALSDGVQLLVRMVRSVGEEGNDGKVDIQAFVDRLDRLKEGEGPHTAASDLADLLDVPRGLNDVLSEYEEHRFRDNIGKRVPFFRMSCDLPLASFDTDLKAITDAIKEMGELLTTLPKPDPSGEGMIGFVLYFTSRDDASAVTGRLAASGHAVEPVSFGSALPAESSALRGTAAPEGRAPAGEELMEDAKGVSNTVRVDIGKLDILMNLVGELTILKSAVGRAGTRMREHATPEQSLQLADLEKAVQSFDKRLVELRDGVMGVRMVPMGQLFTRLQRVTKKIAREMGKPVRIEFAGAETEMDKMIMEEMISPLVHVVRNAIDHGIEGAECRKGEGKREEGLIRFSAFQRGNHVVVEVEDDGAGIDMAKVRAKAVEKGILRPDEEINEDNLLAVLFRPGFSTKETVTEISGRGVGMNVVKESLDRVGGTVEVHSVSGKGTAVILTLPITLAILQALMVRSCGRTFAVPIGSIQEANAVSSSSLRTIEGREVITLRDRTLSLIRLDKVFGIPRGGEGQESMFVVVVGVGSRAMGLLVEELLGKQDIVIKPLGDAFARTPGLAGAAELGDQSTVLVLDVAGLIMEAVRLGGRSRIH